MNDQEMYAAIFDIVEERMQEAGMEFAIDKECCTALALQPPDCTDVLALSYEEDNVLFLKKAYLAMLSRNIDPGALEAWAERTDLPREEFQAMVISGLKGSEEFLQAGYRLENDLYADESLFAGSPAGTGAGGVTLPEKLMKMYRKMPSPLKKAAKKILGAT